MPATQTSTRSEQLIASSGCGYSIARASVYTEFFSWFLRRARSAGSLRVPGSDGRLSLVSRTDVGRCLAALATSSPTGRHHDITGSESLDLHSIASVISRAWDVPVQYVDVSPATFTAELATDDAQEPWWTYAYSSMFASVREHRWESVSEDVQRLTGRPPVPLADMLAKAR